LFDGNGTLLWSNNDWKDSQQAAIQATGLAPKNDLESAILQILQPGKYTAILSGRNGTTGAGLVEVYDVSPGTSAELTNVSTRGFVGTGDNVLIGGFMAGGNSSTTVVVRGLGPALAQPPFNVPGVLADPFLRLFDGNGTLLWSNNDWKDSQQAAIQATGLAPKNDLESAILRTVAPGNYTTILSGRNFTTGIGLVEVYKLQ
jgi:phosphoglycolate phosphatase-like HAD superfamily hydrolase